MLYQSKTTNIFYILLCIGIFFVSGLASANSAPVISSTLPDYTATVGETPVTINPADYFSDPDGDTLTYTWDFSESEIGVHTRGTENGTTITSAEVGVIKLTLTVIDSGGLSVSQSCTITMVVASGPVVTVGTIPRQRVEVGGAAATVDVSSDFSHAEDDELTYTASSSDTTKATVSVSGSTVTITGVAVGASTIRVTATDPDNSTATQMFMVIVSPPDPRAPVTVGTIPNQTVEVGGTAATVDVSSYFSGYSLSYTASSSDTTKATVSVSGATVTITGVVAGTSTISVTATDPHYNATATQTFSVTVVQPNPAPVADPAPVAVDAILAQQSEPDAAAKTQEPSPQPDQSPQPSPDEGAPESTTPPAQPPDSPEGQQQAAQVTTPPVQPPANNQNSGGGGSGGQVQSTAEPPEPVNHTVQPFDYEADGVGKIVFSEWMLSRLNNASEWIEVYNTTDKDINLRGWQIVGRYMEGNDVHLLKSHTLKSLIVQAKETRVIAAHSASSGGGSYSKSLRDKVYLLESSKRLWQGKAIVLELQDSQGNPIDRLGNLNEEDEITWNIPYRTRGNVNKERRISLIRRLKSVDSRQYNFRFGMSEFGWFPADEVDALTESKRSEHFYGHPTDVGAPGYRTAGADPLPVTLSSFIPEIAESGQIVVSWTTASELENAGFNILRSESVAGSFTKLNARLIQGAGTTSDSNAYTWIDTTAQPNVEYYYRIEDMSFDGISEVVATQRLKGLFTAKNRTLTRWATLKKAVE